MKLRDLIEKLYAAGWTAPNDAQHTEIAKLHKELFPHSAALEVELEERHEDVRYWVQKHNEVQGKYAQLTHALENSTLKSGL